ncbi:hypothetical protein PHLCEN_2v8960 [Hermanssonia centrifuga]|uniref:ER membrane protein complex subunit 2 n=1 Tax=Hermanssonia centrifuga TaxID=98765 RepID=A0A2R6NS36_9APHY|nr:hypothetical protein PHLCEN_2v8960 [Hermanssonia centrifuga]
MEFTSALQKLGGYQPRKSQKSQEVLQKGTSLLASQSFASKGDDGKHPSLWESFEKLLLAAMDQGDMDVADECLKVLVEKFPDSPRIDCLTGIVLETKETPETALSFYDALLKDDPSNAAAWRRKVGILKRIGKIDKAVEELCKMLDTFYTEVEGWMELADIYSSCQQYTHALQALSHVLLLAPQNPFHVLHFAETAFLVPDVPLAFKMFLQAVDMTDDEDQDGVSPGDTVPTGLALRAWFGVKLVSRLIPFPMV